MSINTLLLQLFLFLLPTQFGKHFFFSFSYLSGIRVDYLAPTIYLIDLVFVALVFNNLKVFSPLFRKKKLFLLVFMVFLNLLFAQNKFVATYDYLRIVEFILVFYIYKKSRLSAKEILTPLFFSSFVQLVLVLGQLINKHSLQGIYYFLGERYFNLTTPGIAKAVISQVEFLRPYGSFSHPNSLAGFFLLLYFFVLTNKKFNNSPLLKNFFLLISSFLVFVSFSKIAIVAFLTLNIFYLMLHAKKNKCPLCFTARLLVFVILAVLFLSAQTDPQTVQKRLALLQNSFTIILNNLFFGVGAGNYLIAQNKLTQYYLDIINQPVHNVFILFFGQWGIVGLGYLYISFDWLKKKFKKNYLLFLVVVITGFFDHYWLSLIQNFLLIPTVFGFL